MFVVVNVGCIECCVPSNIVGMFSDKIKADSIAAKCEDVFEWRHGGQNTFEVFELKEDGVIGAQT